jgi:hypothetical protein
LEIEEKESLAAMLRFGDNERGSTGERATDDVAGDDESSVIKIIGTCSVLEVRNEDPGRGCCSGLGMNDDAE